MSATYSLLYCLWVGIKWTKGVQFVKTDAEMLAFRIVHYLYIVMPAANTIILF